MEECIRYFKNRPVFHKVFQLFWEKCEGLGHMGGSIRLEGLSREEKVQIGGFLQKDYIGKEPVQISGKTMEKALEGSRFGGLAWEDILCCYFERTLETKIEKKNRERRQKDTFFEELLSQCDEDRQRQWIQEMTDDTAHLYHRTAMSQYREDADSFRVVLQNVLEAAKSFPSQRGEVEAIAVFAARTTGNPHFFDEGRQGERLLYDYLKYIFTDEGTEGLSKTEQKRQLFYRAGILKDDLSNVVLAYRIHGRKKDGRMHEGIEGFFRESQPVQITLRALGDMREMWADADSVYMVENPAVWLCEQYPENAFLCGNGQLRLAVWVLLDLLTCQNNIYYAGDYDPEGLMIAQKLKDRYGSRICFWNYKEEYYKRYISQVGLNEGRLKKLDQVKAEELQEIKKMMLREKKAAYQEAMLETYHL